MCVFCTRPFRLSRIPALIHSGTPGSGHATSIDQLPSLEAGPGCKVGHGGRGLQHFWSKEEIASWLLSTPLNAHPPATGLAQGTHLVLFVGLEVSVLWTLTYKALALVCANSNGGPGEVKWGREATESY